MPYHIKRAIEIVTLDEATVLPVTQHIHKVFITYIKQIIIVIDSIIIAVYDIVNYLINLAEEVKVDFIYIIVLAIAESQLIAHAVSEEPCFAAYVGQVHRCIALYADSGQDYRNNG